MTLAELRTAIEQQAALMTAVATGGPLINDRQAEYKERRREIGQELRRRNLDEPNPFSDLWAWYGFYSANLGRYHERRSYITAMYEPLQDAIDRLTEDALGAGIGDERTGWERVDDQVVQLRQRHEAAQTREDFQSIGLLCRDIFVSLEEACFDRDRHVAEGDDAPAELRERLFAVVETEAAGAANKELRALLKSSIAYANKVQHDRRGTRAQARIAAEATVTAVKLMRTFLGGQAPEAAIDIDDIPF